jgi:hypothetical protein
MVNLVGLPAEEVVFRARDIRTAPARFKDGVRHNIRGVDAIPGRSSHSTRSVFHGDPIAELPDIVFPISSVSFRGSGIAVVRIAPIENPTDLIDDPRGEFRTILWTLPVWIVFWDEHIAVDLVHMLLSESEQIGACSHSRRSPIGGWSRPTGSAHALRTRRNNRRRTWLDSLCHGKAQSFFNQDLRRIPRRMWYSPCGYATGMERSPRTEDTATSRSL